MNIEHLKALAAAVDEGTVEGGAYVLGITASAASQRIRTLESRLGQVLLRRTHPITVTEAGQAVLRYAREVELLESETLDRLHGLAVDSAAVPDVDGGLRREPTVLRIGVNADSMATWFRPVFAEVAEWDDIVVRLELVDQDKALPLLASGDVLGTITSAASGGYGTQVQKLGQMRYTAVARRGLLHKHGARFVGADGTRAEVDLRSLPMVNFGKDDDLQLDFLRANGVSGTPPTSVVPGSSEFAWAVASGVGWGMVPAVQLGDRGPGLRMDEVGGSELVPLTESPTVVVPLYWHHWRLASEKLSRFTSALHRAADEHLR